MAYRMDVYRAGETLWQRHPIHESNDADAKAKAERLYAKLATEPNAPALDRFALYNERDCLVCEIRTRDRR
jgi:hypothetical protein